MAGIVGVRYDEIAIEPMFDAFLDVACAASSQDSHRRRDRGEHPGAHPRHAADGAVEQVRLDRAHDRQQVGDGGRLRDALRRHGGRLRGAEGHQQDARLSALPLPQQPRPRDPRADHHARRRRPSCAPTRPTRTRCRPTTCSTRSSRRYVEHDASPAEIVALGFRAEDVRKVVRLIKINEYKRRQAAVGIRITPRGFGKDWRYPITSAWNEWESVGARTPRGRSGARASCILPARSRARQRRPP